MKFKKVLAAILAGVVLFSTGCSVEKDIAQETSQSNVENKAEETSQSNVENKAEETDNPNIIFLDFIQQPEELIVFLKENLENFNVLNQKYYKILQDHAIKSNDDIPEEAKEIAAQMEAEFKSRKRIDDTNLIKLIYDDIVTLKAEKISTEFATNYYDDILFGFDLVDNKELGKEGNSYEGYIRYIAVMKDNRIFIPIIEDHGDHEHMYYVTATITDELFNRLEDMVSE